MNLNYSQKFDNENKNNTEATEFWKAVMKLILITLIAGLSSFLIN